MTNTHQHVRLWESYSIYSACLKGIDACLRATLQQSAQAACLQISYSGRQRPVLQRRARHLFLTANYFVETLVLFSTCQQIIREGWERSYIQCLWYNVSLH